VEAATAKKETKRSKPTAADRDLALRLGALMLHTLRSGGGAAMGAIDDTGLSFIQVKALVSLASDEGGEHSSVKDVAGGLGVSVPSASRAVDDLVKRGLATRVEDPDDRRLRRISLTAAGSELTDQVMAARVAGLERFAETLTSAERRKLDAALDVLLKREEIADIYRSHARRVRR
jgi:DNA-binding MarR family transcriptional regulator